METENGHIKNQEPENMLLLKYIRGMASETECEQVRDWLAADTENEQTLLQIARLYYACQTRERILARDPLPAYRKVQKRIKRQVRILWLKRSVAAAACFLLGLVVSGIWLVKEESTPVPSQLITVKANAGMRTQVCLPDGTQVCLNSGSTMTYPLPYDEKERRVQISGEAYLDVAHNPEQPFVVSVRDDQMRVKVWGTEFNVQAYEEEDCVQTTLVSGSVEIETLQKGIVTEKVRLQPSDKAVYDMTENKVTVSQVNTESETAWREGRLVFKDTPLPQVLNKLSHFYNVRFEVKDAVIDSYCFTGTFQDKQLSQILDYLRISSQINYEIKTLRTDDSHGLQQPLVILRK